jgi:serine/threonine protein kinase
MGGYKAEATRLRRVVALKFLLPQLTHDPISIQRFRSEAEAASAINHPNICTVHDAKLRWQPSLSSRHGGWTLF